MSVVVRIAQASDHAQLAPLFGELDRLHRENAPWLFRRPAGDPRPLAWLEQRLDDPLSAIFVADVGQCVGLVTVQLLDAPTFSIFIPQRRAVIGNLFVQLQWRRRGIARLLLDASEVWARQHGAPWLEAGVYDFNADASGFFDALGFRTTMRTIRKPLDE